MFVGCKSPLASWLKNEKNQDKQEQKIEKNKEESIEKAKSFVHGTGTALSLNPEPNKYTDVAETLNKRAGLTLGEPSYNNALVMDNIVSGLLSTNAQIKSKAEKDLQSKDKEVMVLQTELEKLQNKLNKIQEEKDKLGLEASTLAEKWTRLLRWIKIIVWGGIIGVVLLFVSQVLSVILPPPYNSLFSATALLIGTIGRAVFKLIPNAKSYANVVPKNEFDTSEKTLFALVNGLQKIRHKEISPEEVTAKTSSVKIKDIIDPILLDLTEKDITRPKIIAIKKELGHI